MVIRHQRVNQARTQLRSSALNALRCEHVHNVKCRPVRILQSHASCHTFSSSSVMLSMEIFLKTTSFPSLRVYKSTVLKRKKKLLFLSQVPYDKVKCMQYLSPFCILFHCHYLHLVSFWECLIKILFAFPSPPFFKILFHFVLDYKSYPFTWDTVAFTINFLCTVLGKAVGPYLV